MYRTFKSPNINGVIVPYDASIRQLKQGLNGAMRDYVVCLRALAWKEDEKSFEILKNELRNKDYYRRRAALENISYHKLWSTKPYLVRELLLDHSEYVVKLALDILNQYPSVEVLNEVVLVYDFWKEHLEIKNACVKYFEENQIDYMSLLWQYNEQKQKLCDSDLVYKNCSQKKPIYNWKKEERMREYLSVIHNYYPEYAKEDVEFMLYALSEEGCGYAAIVSTLLDFFQNNRYLVSNIFPFSLYDENLQINGELLLLDFYCMTDEVGYGMTIGQLMHRFYKFIKRYHIKGKIKLLLRLEEKHWKEKNSYIIMMTRNFVLINEKRKKLYVEEWHYMNVREVDEEENFIVSTWGENYILRRADIGGSVYFVQVKYMVGKDEIGNI
ncbi:MAG: hypothetical protein IJA10_04795 [Lachnospiraceae bacterium]|nr:hypothetical protein [Lachnospiraceae bacterium]